MRSCCINDGRESTGCSNKVHKSFDNLKNRRDAIRSKEIKLTDNHCGEGQRELTPKTIYKEGLEKKVDNSCRNAEH